MCRLVDPQVRQLLGTAPLDASSGQDLARGAAANAKAFELLYLTFSFPSMVQPGGILPPLDPCLRLASGDMMCPFRLMAISLQCQEMCFDSRRKATLLSRVHSCDRWSHVTRTPTYDGASQQELLQVVATSCHSEVNELDFGLPLKDSSLATLVYHGYDIRGVVAAEPCSISGHRLGSFVFIDPRLLGLAPSFRFCPAGWVDLTFFISFLDLKIPQGYELAASGVPLAEDRVQVTDCCTMQLRFVPSGVSVCSAPHRRSSSNLADFGLSPDAPEPAGAHQAIPTQFPGPAATDTPDPEVVLGVATPPLRDDHMSQCSFLIFSVDFQPETITLDLALPCQLEDVMQKLADARDSDVAVYFDNLVPAYPQPDDSFGAVLALPEWFQHDAIVLVDARSIDGRMFAAVFRGRLNRSSILLHLQIEDKPDLLVFSRGALLDADSWFSFQSGETVLIVLQGFHPIPHLQLEDMLQQPQSWDDSLPVLEGPHFPLFLVLSDGGQHQVPVDVEQVRSFADFQQHTSQVLQFSSEHPVFCSSVPRIRDLAVYGHFCKAVLVATERVQRLPMPPSRLSLYTPIVFLDCRRMLQGFTWLAADQGLVDLDRLIAQYQANAPTGYCPNVRGADTEMHFGRPYLRVVYSTLLTVTFVADMPSSDEDASSDAFHDESSAESSDGDTPDTPQEPESGDTRNAMTSSHDLRDRSRSPRPRDHQADGASDEHVRNSCPAKLSISPPIELSADKWTSGSIAIDLTLCPPPGTVFKHCLPTGFLGHDADWFRWDVLDSVTSAPSDPELKAEHSICKLLSEPQTYFGSSEAHIQSLRRATRRLGYSWRYFSAEPESPASSSDADSTDSIEVNEEPTLMHFLVLSPGHTAAHVAFHKILPVTVDETLQQIQAERCPDLCIRYPRLIPAYPQPCPGSGVVLAAPEWCSDEPVARCFLCLDTSAIDGRLFTVAGPPYLSRRHLLHLADLSSVPGIAVHAQGDPIPLDDTAQCHVYDGATFHFLALGAIMPTLFPLATELLSFRSWSPALTAPRSPPESQYCLVHENESILFTMQPGVPTSYRSQIAACLGFTRDRLRLFPANPRISDASLQGYACRSAIAVCEMPRHMPAAAHAVLVDARALLAGWRSYDTVAGRFSCVDALANLRETLPAGWQAVLADFPPHVDLVDTAPGQVIVALAARTPRVVPPLGVTLAAGDRDLSQHRVSGDHPLPTSESAPSGGSTAGDLPDHTHPTGSSDVGTSSNTRHNQPILYHTCVFLVLGQNYTPEMIEVRLAAGTDVQDAMRLVAAARSPRDAALLPGLVPVHPQPCLTHGLAISVPSWPCPGALVAFDLRPIGGSAFALHLAGHMSRQDLLQAAQIDEDFQGEIFVGSLPWPLLADMRILLVTGDLVIFRPVNDVHHCVASLSDMLHAPEAWNGAYDPTAEWGNDADKYAHLPAQDLAYCGAPVRGIFAVSADAHVSTARRTQEVHCFIDARPVLLHVSSLFCTRNLLDVAAVISRYAPRCPPAWEVCLLRSNMRRIFAEDDPRVTAGEVIIVTFQMHSGPSAMPGLVRTESTDEDAHDAEPDTEDHEDPIPSSNDPILPNPCGYLADTGGTRLDTDSATLLLSAPSIDAIFAEEVRRILPCIFRVSGGLANTAILNLDWMRRLSMLPDELPIDALEGSEPLYFEPSELVTLLDHAAAASHEWAFLAATLIEVLEEHEAERQPHLSAVGTGVKSLSLAVLIPPRSSRASEIEVSLESSTFTAMLAPLVSDPFLPLSIGQTQLRFSWHDVLAFLGAPCDIHSWDRVCARFYGQHASAWERLPAFIENARRSYAEGCIPCDTVWCYTDGSFTPPNATASCRMGWAAIFIQPMTCQVSCSWGSVPAGLHGPSDSGSAVVAECFALLAGALIAVNRYTGCCVHFLSDCQSALAIVSGHAAWATGGIAEAAAGAHALRRVASSASVPDQYAYVPGHQGILPNEIVDFLSKQGANFTEGSCGLHVPSDVCVAWLSCGGPKLPWIGVAVRALLCDPAYPPLNTCALGNDRDHGNLGLDDLMRPFAPPGALEHTFSVADDVSSTSAARLRHCVSLHLVLATYNTLSLLGDVEETRDQSQNGRTYRSAVGRAAILAETLDSHGVQIAFLQETRCQKGHSRVGAYHRYASGAVKGQWGTEIWIKDNTPVLRGSSGNMAPSPRKAHAVTSLHTDPRRVILRVCLKPVSLLLVSIHGPHRATEGPLIQAFWDETLRLLKFFHRNDFILLGGDCNASVGSEPSDSFGNHAPEDEDAAGAALHHLARTFQLWGPATFGDRHSGATHTYVQKKSGRLCRPDFLLLPMPWERGQVSSYTAPGIHAAQGSQDHIAACLRTILTLGPAHLPPSQRRRSVNPQAFNDPVVRQRLSEVLESLPTVPWTTSVHAHAAILVDHLQRGLGAISSDQGRRPKHAYLTEDTWQLQRRLSRIRHGLSYRQSSLRRHALLTCLAVWRQTDKAWATEFLDCPWVQQLKVSIVTQLLHMRKIGQLLRAACRRDRSAYLADLADRISTGPTNEVFAAYHRLLSHRRKKPYQIEPLPTILDERGAPCLDMQARFSRWRGHFGALEAGVETSFAALAEHAVEPSAPAAHFPHPTDISQVPSVCFMEKILTSMKGGKAPGLDAIPAELCKGFSPQLSRHLFPLLMKQVWRGEEAVGFKGGTTVFFHKKRGPQDECASYRAILLMSSLAKACHQCIRPAIKEVFARTAAPLQLGGRAGCSVTFGSHLLRAVTTFYSAKGIPTYVLFADIASAFYCTVTQLIANAGAVNQAQVLDRVTRTLHLSQEDREALENHLRAPTALTQASAEPWLEHVTSRLASGNWFVIQGDSVPIATGRGSRPGSSWADVLFALLIPRILAARNRLRDSMNCHSTAPVFPWDGDFTLAPCTDSSASLQVSDVIWADDIAVPRVCRCLGDMRSAIAAETGCLADGCGEFGLSLSFGEVKTACLASVVGNGSRAAKRYLYGQDGLKGVVHALRESGNATSLSLVATYKHLGVYQAPLGRLGPEVRYRISQARAAFHEARRKVYKNRAMSIARKAAILEATVISRLVQGAGSWARLSKTDQHAFDATLWAFYRSLLCLPRDGEQTVTALACCALVKLPSPAIVLRRARLQYLRQLVAAGPPALWAAVKADRSYATMLQEDLRWMFQWLYATSDLPNPDNSWEPWSACMRDAPGRFKGCLKRACLLETYRVTVVAALDGLHRGLSLLVFPPTLERAASSSAFPELCLPCRRAFVSRKAWAGHAARMHGYRSRAFLLGKTPVCLGCGRSYGTIGRLRRHLAVVPACAAKWGSFTPAQQGDTLPHPLAPPAPIDGCYQHVVSPWDPSISDALLADLNALGESTEDSVWNVIEEHIEPLSILRATVEHWRDSRAESAWHAEITENMLLLLDSAEQFPEGTTNTREDPYQVPVWCTLAPLCFSLSGEVRTWSLERPPPVCLDLSGPTSVTLRQARAIATWTEDACRVLIECASIAPSQPVAVFCPGLWAPLPVLLPWFQDEAKRAVLSVLSMLWLLKGDYEQMVSCQKLPTRLSRSTWTAIQELLCWEMTPSQLTALLVLLAIRGLSKSADFTKLCPPSERRSPESVLEYAVSNLKSYIPSLAGLPAESADYVVSTVRMLGQFSFPQFLQGENNSHSVWMLQSCLKQEEEVVFKMFLLAQVCVLCGVTGAKSIQGSHFLNELNGRSVLKALSCLQNIAAVA
ncbi:hypothetical protein AK812_SmicGene25481 [Symbiodinium microadriaticum]|uniref:RNase H type-1 domain-containing protein n=1 Tax=Symbiodinium microadriaticum TaxID=2951 RepID=A0A1Q9DBT2_SYMMI|nr:hypothetical protein AK812_SmicGene25481 [Symbiodinium microadriaticum]